MRPGGLITAMPEIRVFDIEPSQDLNCVGLYSCHFFVLKVSQVSSKRRTGPPLNLLPWPLGAQLWVLRRHSESENVVSVPNAGIQALFAREYR